MEKKEILRIRQISVFQKIIYLFLIILTFSHASANELIYSTFLGGGMDDRALAITADTEGNIYVTGYTYSSDFPVTAGALYSVLSAGNDVFLSKFNSSGALLYSTFIGGSSYDEGCGITLDKQGFIYITGGTWSTDFPTTPSAFDTSFNTSPCDVFVCKIDITGSNLIYSTFIGGKSAGLVSNGVDIGRGIAVDSAGNAFVTGQTGSSDFPTTPLAYDRTFNNDADNIFVLKFNSSGSGLLYSTYLHSIGNCYGYGIAVDSAGNAFVTGVALSGSFFPTTPGAFQTTSYGGTPIDAFLTKLNPLGRNLVFSTLLGRNGWTMPCGIALDKNDNAYLMGYTAATDFPVTAGSIQTTFQGTTYDLFAAQFHSSGSTLNYCTFLGESGPMDYYRSNLFGGIAVDSARNAYITGWTSSNTYPVTPYVMDSSFNGYIPFYNSTGDAVISILDSTGTSMIYSSYLGGDNNESGTGIALDSSGNIWITGFTDSSANFPITANASDSQLNNYAGDTDSLGTPIPDAFVIKLNLSFQVPVELSDFSIDMDIPKK